MMGTYEKAEQSFMAFMDSAQHLLHIQNDADYENTSAWLESLAGRYDESIKPLYELVVNALEAYELEDPLVASFVEQAMSLTDDASTLRFLMDQHQLNTSDLPEVGDKSIISRILSGQRQLTRKHIAALCLRFSLASSFFISPPTPTQTL
jgi:HTH-type transcriptional regulator/antitoxin HigA